VDLRTFSLQASDFELMGLPEQYAIDGAALDAQWKALQRAVHPDRFAAEGPAAQRLAMQWSVRVNEAYQRLKHPLRRAAYLCERQGVGIDAERNTAMPAEFLMQQMAWREALDDASTPEAVETLTLAVREAGRERQAELARLLDQLHDPQAAAGQVRALMFIERFTRDLAQRADALDH
jgi:molecular chaperone HscB